MSLLRALVTAAVVLMVLGVLGLAAIGTPGGSAWIVGTLADLAGERLVVTGVSGTLLEGLAVERLQLTAGRVTLVVEPADLAMSWPDLVRRQLRLTTARADSVRIDIAPKPPDEPDTPVEPLLLPVAIVAEPLEVGSLVIRNGVGADGQAASTVAIGPVAFEGALVDGVVRIGALRVEGYGLRVQAAGSFGTGEPFAVDARVGWRADVEAPAGGPVRGAGTLAGDLAALRFEQVLWLPTPVGVGGLARLLGDEPGVFAEARWRDLALTPADDPATAVRSRSGLLKVQGWTDGFDAATDAVLEVGTWPAFRLRATARGDTTHAALAGIRVDGWGGQVTGSGDLDWAAALAGVFRLEGRGLDPAVLDPRASGRVGFTAAIQVDGAGGFRLSVPAAGGTLLGRPFAASGIVSRRAGVLAFDDVRVKAGPNRAELNGTLGGTGATAIGGRFRVEAPDLAALWPGYAGSLTAAGRFGGTTDRPTVDGEAAGRDLAAGDLRIGSLAVRGGLGARQVIDLRVGAEGIRAGDRPVGDLALEVSGPVTAHRVALGLGGGDVAVDLDAAGGWRAGVLTETIGRATVTVPGDQRWTLGSPATVRVAAPDYRLSAHCWSAGEAELCLADGRYGPRGFAGGADLRRFPLASLARWLPPDLGLAGTADLAVTAEGDPARPEQTLRGSVRASLAGAEVTWRVPDDEDVSTAISEFAVAADLADGVLDFRGTIAGDYGLALAAAGRVTGALGDAPGIEATVKGGIPDLAAVGPVVERLVDIGDLKGRVVVDVALSGAARQPDIAGGVQLEDGAFTVPVAGVRIDRIGIALDGLPDGKLALKGNARSGKGYVALDGALAWRDQLVPSAEATVKGRVFDVINLPEGLVQVSPDARVVLRDGQFRVSGTMLVPRAAIRLKKIAESAVSPSPDTIVHGRDVQVVEKGPPLFVLDGLQVRLGERVTFEGFGLKTSLTGGLRLGQSLAADPGLVTGDGVVSLKEGQFTAFGQKLAIDRGSLVFSGIVTDPGIDVKASRTVDYEGREVVVGVLLSGNISRIQTRVFSEPAMGELDALSYLTTGKPLSAAGAGDRSLVASSAISLGLSQALPVVQQIGSALSVDEVSFDTTDTGGTAVVVGEQLGKNLFIRYSYGIFDKLGTVQATYKLGRRLSIEGSSGTEQSLDLVYSVTW